MFELITTNSSQSLKDFLFDRPINKLFQKNVAVCFDTASDIKRVSDIYQTIKVLNHHPILITENSNELSAFSVDFELHTDTKKTAFSNTDDAIDRINQCSYCIIGSTQLSSRWQLFYEKLVVGSEASLIYASSSYKVLEFAAKNRHSQINLRDVAAFDFACFLRLAKKMKLIKQNKNFITVQNKLWLINEVAQNIGCNCISIDPLQILAVSNNNSKKAVVVNNSKNAASNFSDDFIGVVASFMSDVDTSPQNFLKTCAVSAQVYRLAKLKSRNLAIELKQIS